MKHLKGNATKIIIFLMGLLLAFCFSGCCKPPAKGTLDYAVINADYIAHGYITEREYKEFRDEFVTTHTIYTLTIDKMIKGRQNMTGVLINSEGGVRPDGTVISIQSNPPQLFHQFRLNDELLACFRIQENTYEYVSVIPGGTWIKGDVLSTAEHLQEHLGKILKIMYSNDLPISLPKSEWPSFPTGPFLLPWQK